MAVGKASTEPLLPSPGGPQKVDLAAALKPAIGGSLAGFLTLFRAVSFSLCYAHADPRLTPYFGLFLQSLLLSTVLSQLTYGWRHSLPWAIACPSSTATPFNSALAAAAAAGAASGAAAALRCMVAMALGSLGTAGLFWAIRVSTGPRIEALKGSFPQPLILGLFASVGISMVQGGLALTGEGWLQPSIALVSGACMRLTTRSERFGRNAAALPFMLGGQLAAFHVLRVLLRASLEASRAGGWLFDKFEAVSFPDYLAFLARVFQPASWGPAASAPLAGLLGERAIWSLVISVLPLLMLDLITVIAPFEAIVRQSLPLGTEFGIAAASNLLAALTGGGASYASLSPSKLCLEAGGPGGWLSTVSASAVPALGLTFIGPAIVSVTPKFLVAGLLVHLGLGYLLDGLWDPRRVLTSVAPAEYFVIFVIIVCSLVIGLAEGIFVGLLLLSLFFVFRYAQGEVVQFACCAQELPALRGRKYRPTADWDALRPLLSRVFMVRTNCSHLFFGSIAALIGAAPCASDRKEKQFLLLDLDSVRSIDSSAIATLHKFPANIVVFLIALRQDLIKQLQDAQAWKGLICYSNLDAAMEKVEDLLLNEVGGPGASLASNFASFGAARQDSMRVPACAGTLTPAMVLPRCETRHPVPLPAAEASTILCRCLPGAPVELLGLLLESGGRFAAERRFFVRGEVVCQQGEPCLGMLVCLRGVLTVYEGTVRLPLLPHEAIGMDPLTKRIVGPRGGGGGGGGDGGEGSPEAAGRPLRGLGPGDVVGGVALVVAEVRKHSESLVADTECELLEIRREVVLKLEASQMRLALELHKALARRLLAGNPSSSGDMPVATRDTRLFSDAAMPFGPRVSV